MCSRSGRTGCVGCAVAHPLFGWPSTSKIMKMLVYLQTKIPILTLVHIFEKLELSFYYSSEELARRLQEEENSQAQEQPQQPHQPQRGEAAGVAATPAAPSTSRGTAGGSPGRNQSGASSSTQRTKNVIPFFLYSLVNTGYSF